MPDLDAKRKHLTTASQLLDDQAKFCRKTMPDSLKKVYLRFLAPLTPEELQRAFLGWQFKTTRFPSVAELLECCGRSPSQQAEKNWLYLESRRDRIADEVCRSGDYLVNLRTLNHASEFNSGIAKRDLKARFIAEYSDRWLDWWSRGEIDHGESVIDYSPKPIIPLAIADEDKPTQEELNRLNAKLKQLGMKVSAKKGIQALNQSDELEF